MAVSKGFVISVEGTNYITTVRTYPKWSEVISVRIRTILAAKRNMTRKVALFRVSETSVSDNSRILVILNAVPFFTSDRMRCARLAVSRRQPISSGREFAD